MKTPDTEITVDGIPLRTPAELETNIWGNIGVRVVLRSEDQWGYNPIRKEIPDWWLADDLVKEIREHLSPKNRKAPSSRNLEIMIIMGDGEEPHPNTLIRSIRASYNH